MNWNFFVDDFFGMIGECFFEFLLLIWNLGECMINVLIKRIKNVESLFIKCYIKRNLEDICKIVENRRLFRCV